MFLFNFCFRCYLDLRIEQWDIINIGDPVSVLRCPRCKTFHTVGPEASMVILP